jgi:hypothetical protein
MKQLSLDLSKPFPVHSRENNRESEDFLNENRESFSANCEKVLALLKSGVRLTVKDAIVNHGVSSLPRRILDLKQAGIEIKDAWISVEGKRGFKEWYILK